MPKKKILKTRGALIVIVCSKHSLLESLGGGRDKPVVFYFYFLNLKFYG